MMTASEARRRSGQSLADVVRAEIRARIRQGRLRPGERLLETELAADLAVSRTPVREAIGRLTSEGLLVPAPPRGVMVPELSKTQVQEIYALREMLEGAAARLAAQFAGAEEIAVLRQALESSAATQDPQEYADFNRAFHDAIHEAAHNRYLASALAQLADSLALLPGTTFEAEGRLAGAKREHLGILEAIEGRDADLAELLARKHIRQAQMTRVQMMFASSLGRAARGGTT
jgi:DNA-binding GntR family transcriptional regulator